MTTFVQLHTGLRANAGDNAVAAELLHLLQSPSASGRLVGALAVAAWAAAAQGAAVPPHVTDQIFSLLAALSPSQPTPGAPAAELFALLIRGL